MKCKILTLNNDDIESAIYSMFDVNTRVYDDEVEKVAKLVGNILNNDPAYWDIVGDAIDSAIGRILKDKIEKARS